MNFANSFLGQTESADLLYTYYFINLILEWVVKVEIKIGISLLSGYFEEIINGFNKLALMIHYSLNKFWINEKIIEIWIHFII